MNELEDTIVTADYNYEWKVIITFQSHVLKQDLIDNCDCILRMQHSLEKITLELSRYKSGGSNNHSTHHGLHKQEGSLRSLSLVISWYEAGNEPELMTEWKGDSRMDRVKLRSATCLLITAKLQRCTLYWRTSCSLRIVLTLVIGYVPSPIFSLDIHGKNIKNSSSIQHLIRGE